MSKKIYYLSSPEDCVPRYVGCTKLSLEKRLKSHLFRCNDKDPRSIWVKSLLNEGIVPTITLLEVVNDCDNWEDREKYYIALFRSKFPLLNVSAGGLGVLGMVHGEETRKKLSEKLLGKIRSEETRKKMSACKRGSKNVLSKRVQCIETGEIYPCAREAARCLGMYRCTVSIAIHRGVRCGGSFWRYVDENGEQSNLRGEKLRDARKPRDKKVLCVETGQVFNSGAEASRSIGLDASTIGMAIARGNKSGGYHWKYLDNE